LKIDHGLVYFKHYSIKSACDVLKVLIVQQSCIKELMTVNPIVGFFGLLFHKWVGNYQYPCRFLRLCLWSDFKNTIILLYASTIDFENYIYYHIDTKLSYFWRFIYTKVGNLKTLASFNAYKLIFHCTCIYGNF